jgi:YD repeat-containing protein
VNFRVATASSGRHPLSQFPWRLAGSGSAAITATTFSDTFGKTVLTQQFPSAGVTNFAINTYDILENLVTTRDELGKTNTLVYDPLNRVKTQVLPKRKGVGPKH